jgi:hypothetical protein
MRLLVVRPLFIHEVRVVRQQADKHADVLLMRLLARPETRR